MDYSEAAGLLFGLDRYPPRRGTVATAELLDALGNPHEDLACVQVAGSNGKGTTARMVESTLREAGAEVGLYTSPHTEDVRERVRVQGRPIAKRAVVEFVAAAEGRLRGETAAPPTFFEATTALALWEFDRRGVDVAVLEVGIGGRYDATSVVDPVAAAVTSVTLEHTEFLGDTVEEIARDKAQVVPERGPLITATDGAALAAVREVAGDQVVTVGRVGDDREGHAGTEPDVRVAYGGRVDHVEAAVTVAGGDAAVERAGDGGSEREAGGTGDDLLADSWRVGTRLPTPGAHQAENAGVATALARAVLVDDRVTVALDPEFDLDPAPGVVPVAVAERGLRRARWPGRFEALSTRPLVVLDGAHNPGACERLAETLAEFDRADCHLVLGALVDKDHAGMVDALPEAATVHVCRPPVERGEAAATLAGVVARSTDDDATAPAVTTHETAHAAVEAALAAADAEDGVLVTGSQYLVREVRRRWSGLDRRPRVRDADDAARVAREADLSSEQRRAAAGETLARTLRLRVGPQLAAPLERTALAADLVCRVAETDDEEPREVVLAGPVAGLREFAARLDDRAELAPVADRIRRALGASGGADGPAGEDAGGRPLGPPALPGAAAGDGTAVFRDAAALGVAGAVEGRDRSPVGDDRLPWLAGETPTVMGIVNVTPDSFHDGGQYDAVDAAVERAHDLVEAGVGVLDVGGESTRPGADPVAVRREIERVRPVVEAIREAGIDTPVSVDTRKAPVAREALEAGADVVNDVSGLEDPDLPRVAAEYDAGLVVMHSLAAPVDPDREAEYDDVVREVAEWLRERVLFAERVGVDRERVVVDPGLGFGKSASEDFELLDRLAEFRALGCPVLVGHSHKSMFGAAGYEAGERLEPTVAATALAVDRGADVVRVHDAAENVAALRTAVATRRGVDRDGTGG
ncbi:dihydropteroate synthase [Halobacteriales archaeon SW_5_70_135]|nr:MAG: dihydropteroate synthase [Halobacteriales archaeon SW_5_70_135]